MQPTVFLFDVDGVLLRPGGYRAAVRATVNDFTNRMGLGDLAPDDETLAIFEAQGITCEWDMVPLTLATILEAACRLLPALSGAGTLDTAVELLRRSDVRLAGIGWGETIRSLGRYVTPGEAPADSVYAACAAGQADGLYPRLVGSALLRGLLLHTRRPALSRTTHVFEAYALGHEVFSATLGLPTDIRSESLLARHDVPLLSPAQRGRLVRLHESGRLRMAAYTARPSNPVRPQADMLAVFAPEAEMGLGLVNLPKLQLVGSGQTGEAAMRLGENEDRLTKPAPYHALAAVAAAWLGDRAAALDWTEAVFVWAERGGPNPGLFDGVGRLPAHFRLHVFEDSPTGIAGGKAAARLLETLGASVDLSLWGVSAHPEKMAALSGLGAVVLPDVNAALDRALVGMEQED